MDMTFSGSGEHRWLWLEKTGANTEWAARQLAKACQVPPRQVGYAGLKDRHGITGQWFSVQLPRVSETETINAALPANLRVKESHWHHKKLRTGALQGNSFVITLRHVQGDRNAAEVILQQLKNKGFPNFFGRQRFGRSGENVQAAARAFTENRLPRQRHRRGLLLSAARSFLFNAMLARRVDDGSWSICQPGDVVQLNGSRSWFVLGGDTAEINETQQRLTAGDVHLTGALWGRGELPTQHRPARLEQAVAKKYHQLALGLEKAGLSLSRRPLRCLPEKLSWQWQPHDNALQLAFSLPAGSYATELLAELGHFEQPASP